MEPSGKYFASLLYEGYSCENQAAVSDYSTAKILGIDYAMQGMAVFSEKIETEEADFFRKNEKRLAREQRKLSRCVRGSHNSELQKKKVARCHEKIRNTRRAVSYTHLDVSKRQLNYYAIGDTLNLLYGFVSPKNTETMYDFMILLRMYLAGITFIMLSLIHISCIIKRTRGNTKAILRRRSRPLRCMHRSTLSFCVSGMWSSHRFGDGTDR